MNRSSQQRSKGLASGWRNGHWAPVAGLLNRRNSTPSAGTSPRNDYDSEVSLDESGNQTSINFDLLSVELDEIASTSEQYTVNRGNVLLNNNYPLTPMSNPLDDTKATGADNKERQKGQGWLDFQQLFQVDVAARKARYGLAHLHTHTLDNNDIAFSTSYDVASDFYGVAVQNNKSTTGGTNKVVLFNTNEEGIFPGVDLISPTTYGRPIRPAAMAVMCPGIRYAVLSESDIISCTFDDNKKNWKYKIIFNGSSHGMNKIRGLTVDPGREVLFSFESNKRKILCIDGKESAHDELLFSYDYGRPTFSLRNHAGILQFGNVSFLDFHRGTLALSDLGTWKSKEQVNQCLIRSYKIDYDRNTLIPQREYFNDDSFQPNNPGYIKYGSGILIDDNGWMIVGDASKGVIHVFNDALRPICIVRTFGEPGQRPYIAGIALSTTGALLVSPHKQAAQIIVYRYQEDDDNANIKNLRQPQAWNQSSRRNYYHN